MLLKLCKTKKNEQQTLNHFLQRFNDQNLVWFVNFVFSWTAITSLPPKVNLNLKDESDFWVKHEKKAAKVDEWQAKNKNRVESLMI